MHSRKPLSMEANSGVINIESTYADVTEESEPQLTALYSWKNEADTFGVLFGYTSQNAPTGHSLVAQMQMCGALRVKTLSM
nr:hypothetical protein [Pseudoalteromonas sp.]